jgi:putative addiction module component (TIGR02574 family)
MKLMILRVRSGASGSVLAVIRPTGLTNLRELAVGTGMNSKEASVFNLSPAEKLQLVEDLWDDLASTPEAVPVHDWQKQELARRKANLLKNPASASTWQDVMRRVRGRDGG